MSVRISLSYTVDVGTIETLSQRLFLFDDTQTLIRVVCPTTADLCYSFILGLFDSHHLDPYTGSLQILEKQCKHKTRNSSKTSKSSRINDFHLIWQGVCHLLLVISSNLGLILHHLATVHPWQTDGRTTTMTTARQLLKYGQLKIIIIGLTRTLTRKRSWECIFQPSEVI